MRPRASRLPVIKTLDDERQSLNFASKASRWLDENHLVKRGGKTRWKQQYKLRHNWTSGSAAVNEIEVAEQAPVPPVIVQMHDEIIYMADSTDGIRAWSTKGERKMMAQMRFDPATRSPPTSLAIDAVPTTSALKRAVVGFEDGSFGMYTLETTTESFTHEYSHEPSINGVISSVAVAWPYIVTMTATQLLSLYRCDVKTTEPEAADPPRLLHSLKSHTVWPPLTTSLRLSGASVIVTIAYALPTYLSGWTVGVQEVKLTIDGKLAESRITSAIDQHYRPLAFSASPTRSHLAPAPGALATSTTLELRHIHSKPTSLSYTHPYLLVSHPDNTLTLYLVSSTVDSLTISAGSRLFGHTSSVSGAQVGNRGKAVSVSKRGDELRVWELEGGFASASSRKRLAIGDLSVRVRSGAGSVQPSGPSQAGLNLVTTNSDGRRRRVGEAREPSDSDEDELTLTRGWIGFDDENVVVLKEQSQGRQALVVYDFT